MDRLDGVSNVRKINERENSWQNDTKLHRMRAVDQSKRVQEMDEIGSRNVGTCDASRTFLSRPNDDPNRCCSNPNWNKSVEDRIEEELERLDNIGVFAANADTEKLYSAVKEDNEKKGGRQ